MIERGWHRATRALAVVATAAIASIGSAPSQDRAVPPPVEVWFAPAPGTADYPLLFEAADEWLQARAKLGVFKFYQGHTQASPPAAVYASNSYARLAGADAFRLLTWDWRKALAIEVGVVKEFYCASGAAGLRRSVDDSLAAIRAVEAAGGLVGALAMDEPFLAGVSPACGGPAPEPTLDWLTFYTTEIRRRYPAIEIGLIEPYPYFGADRLVALLERLDARGIRPAFFHLDIDLAGVGKAHDVTADIATIARASRALGSRFGLIIWGQNGDADARYVADALRLVDTMLDVLQAAGLLPDDLVFQSWAESSSGRRFTPRNLPEWRRDTHTQFLNRVMALVESSHSRQRTDRLPSE